MKIYLAGGWFSPQQEEEHTRIYNYLNSFLESYVSIFNPRLESNQNDIQNIGKNILLTNIEAINKCDVMVCITDYKDMGTLWEAGYAYANKKVIVYYAETLGNNAFNLMLAKTGYVTQSLEQLFVKLTNLLDDGCKFKAVYDDYKGVIE